MSVLSWLCPFYAVGDSSPGNGASHGRAFHPNDSNTETPSQTGPPRFVFIVIPDLAI